MAGIVKKAVSSLLIPTSLIKATKEEKGCKPHTAHGHKRQRAWDIAVNRKQRDW